MPPLDELKTTPIPIVVPDRHNKSKYFFVSFVVVSFVIIIGLLTYIWPRSDDTAVATFACGGSLSWKIIVGHTMNETYGGQINARTCEYYRAELYKKETKVFSVTNPTDCRDFKSWIDLYNGIDEPFYNGHHAFPAGAPIVSAVAVPDAVVPPAESVEFGYNTNQLGFQISTKSGLTPQEFVTASKCALDHRNELQDTFGALRDDSIGSLSWLALVDETASYGPGDLPGVGQIYSCSNGYTYRTSSESLFALAPGESPEKADEFGLPLMNDKQIAVIGFDGKLYEPDRTNSGLYISLPYADHRIVNERTLPASLSACVNDRGTTLAEYLIAQRNNTVYEPLPENYTPRPMTIDKPSDTSVGGIAPTESENSDCETKYAANVATAATEYAKTGGLVSKALFYSPSLSMCIGVVQIVQDNVTNIQTFDPETGEMLNITDTAVAFQDWSLSTSE